MLNHPEPGRARPFVRLAVLGAAAAMLLAGCGKSGGDDSSTTTTAAKAAVTTTTAAATTTAADGGGGASDPWAADAKQYRGKDGQTFDFDCPAGGEANTIWGTETYTDDSSVCTAGVQVGLITFDEGGKVTIEIAAGQDSYDAGTANDVTSVAYASWDGSFTFPDAPPGSGTFEASTATWSVTAQSLQLAEGDTRDVVCSKAGELGSVWGTDTYTADSSICTAAVHQGLITQAAGGGVRIKVTAGADSYEGTTAHGITSNSYGSFALSYTFPDDQPQN
ncbi:LCCL domain-containing protein [Aquihabitans sp. McL0605]|uniref:LCCL domain-containing protein n=1 Tax=Aquihabitans sp. McL0605 TaxID=3415671 RepID=UPI003CEFF8C6